MTFNNTAVPAMAFFLLIWHQMSASADTVPAKNPILAKDGWLHKNASSGGVGGRAGAYGANRIIEIYGGYGGVKGTFIIPEFSAGTNINPNNPNPDLRNPNHSKPGLYLGAKGSMERGTFVLDAGIVYEPVSLGDQGVGWSTFVLITMSNAGPEKEDVYRFYESNDALDLPKGDSEDFSLLVTDDGAVTLDVADFSDPVARSNPALHPNLYPVVTGKLNKSSMSVRRVVAMSQSAGPQPKANGAYIHDAHFTKGQVRKWGPDGTALDWSDWSSGKPTYLPRAYNKGYEQRGYEHGPLFMVNSTPPWNRIPTKDGPDRPDNPISGYHSRYYDEGVDINLLSERAGDLGGEPKQPGKSKPKGK